MADIAIYDTVTYQIVRYRESVNTPFYQHRNDVIVDPIMPGGVPLHFLKYNKESGVVYEIAEEDKQVWRNNQALILESGIKERAKSIFSNTNDSDRRLILATNLVVLDEINNLRGAVSPSLPPRTKAQFRNAVRNKIDNIQKDELER